MDISTPLVFIGIFIVACLVLFFVYKFEIKEKSYEEALAEQRQQTNALLGVKPKPKEKKSKKAAKKAKEKQPAVEAEGVTEVDNEESSTESSHHGKLHVEFKAETEEVTDVPKKKHNKKEKVRPILMHKDNVIAPDVNNTSPFENHFEKIHPKDEFELLRANSKDDLLKPQEPVKEKPAKEKKVVNVESENGKISKKATKHTVVVATVEVPPVVVAEKEKEEKTVEVVAIPQTNGLVANTGKEKKKKKSEFNTLQQLTAERDGLLNMVRKADLSRSEVQILIDLLLNKQLDSPAALDDWSEGKSDPVQKLKKQLADKEKALAEEQEALVGSQAKLREVRAEQHAERVQLQQKIRALEETFQAKQLELHAGNSRMQGLTQKLQQLQAQLNEELIRTHQLREENNALQQQQQIRNAQNQETESIIAKLRNDAQELSTHNQQLRLELQRLSDEHFAEKEHQQQAFILQLNNLKKELEQSSELSRQLEEAKKNVENTLEKSMREENDWKIENSKLKSLCQQQAEEIRRFEHESHQLKEGIKQLTNLNNDSTKAVSQLKSDLQKAQDDKNSHVNGSSEVSKAHKVEILNLTNELSSAKHELQQTLLKYKQDLEVSDNKYLKLESELEEQKVKNNVLRTKNWKVMDALNAAESRCKSSSATKQIDVNLDKLAVEIRDKEQDCQKQFIQRLFPEIEGLQSVATADWQSQYATLIKSYLSNLENKQQKTESAEVAPLQAQLVHYKNVIDDTEGMLNKLESKIQDEEKVWRNELDAKSGELEEVGQQVSQKSLIDLSQGMSDSQGVQFAYKCIEKSLPLIIDELQSRVKSLEDQLTQERDEKQRLSQEIDLLQSKTSVSEAIFSPEEISRWEHQLRVEPTKNGDSPKAQNCNSNSTNGPALIKEQTLSSSSSVASSLAEVSNKKSKSKKKKKKGGN